MSIEILMPQLSDTMEEGKILRWNLHPGDAVKKGDSLAEVETDKANMEVEAFDNGILSEIIVGEGQTAPVGSPIAKISEPSESRPSQTQQAPIVKSEPAPKLPVSPPEKPTSKDAPTTVKESSTLATEEPPAKPKEKIATERISVSPLAKKLAQAYDIDLSNVHGTGPDGRIIERDVDQLIQIEKKVPQPQKAPQALPLSKMRQTIGQRMTASKQQIPHFYVTMSARCDELVAFYETFQRDKDIEVGITYTHFLVQACAKALAKHPRVNAAFENNQLVSHNEINIAIAIALEDGLIAPVLHQVNHLSLLEIAEQAHGLMTRAKNNTLTTQDLTRGTFTLSNMGMYGVEDFAAIINPPQAAILAVGALQETAFIENHQVIPGYQMKLTLSADHRVLNGVEAANFLQTVCKIIENPLLSFI